jgi:rhamnosyltransferase
MTETPPPVIAVVVTYQPDPVALCALVDALAGQVRKTLVVDNGSHADVAAPLDRAWPGSGAYEAVRLGTNLGVAAAQNAGIRLARAAGAEAVILFDQDSLPAPDMVARLLAAVRDATTRGIAVAAAGPRYTDVRQNNPPPFLRIRGVSVERMPCPDEATVVEVDYLISSGCLIPLSAIDRVGAMREDLFIDYVDIEWGLRARRKGLTCLGVCGAHMRHDLGEAPLVLFGRRLPLHSPLRHYYHFRNAVRLYCEPGLPWNWKLADAWRLLLKYGVYSLCARPRFEHWRMMTLGIVHGLRRRMGQYTPSPRGH